MAMGKKKWDKSIKRKRKRELEETKRECYTISKAEKQIGR